MKYGSVCSGIEAATVAWHPLGWKPSFFSEIEPHPRAVLQHHYPDVPLHGDFTTIEAGQYDTIDLLVGGTPCQSFSIAGLRGGMDDDRGNLALEFLKLADRLKPKWIVWENVPGVLSSNDGRDFGTFLGAMGELGYGWSYRVLDAQYTRVDGFEHAVPQRRRRVFVVGYLGDWRRAAAVLFDREGMCWNPAPRREPGKTVAALIANGVGTCGADDNQAQAGHLIASTGDVSHALCAKGGSGRLDPNGETLVAFSSKDPGADASENVAPTLRAMGHANSHQNGGGQLAAAIQERATAENPNAGPDGKGWRDDGAAYTLEARTTTQAVATDWAVRRLMPVECERLQGFPDDYTAVPYRGKPMADGPRYKALGNSMAVNVMRHIGARIQAVEDLDILPSQRDLRRRASAL